jgi:hypothetical protein
MRRSGIAGSSASAREALVEAGVETEPLDGLPAVITVPVEKTIALRFEEIVGARHVIPASVIPLWEDVAITSPAKREYVTSIASSAISTPA